MSRSLLVLIALASALPASASDIGSVKCLANQDRVWVYDSLSSFDVEAKLRCGETVEIVSRVKGFVRIRTANGVDGYVPESVFPDLPPLEDKESAPASPAPRPVANANPVAAAQPAPASAPAPAKSSTAALVAPQPAKSAAPTATVAKKVNVPASSATVPLMSSSSHSTVPAPSAAIVPAKTSVAPVSAMMVPRATSALPPRDLATSQPSAPLAESEDYPEAQPENESADPSCRVFFSAYGLSPAQYKWLVDNRRKQFSSICPAPDIARVDYVILFAHDSDSYLSAMPAPVHTDPNGFSDFSPITMLDTAIMSASELEKTRYEFVWVFRMKRESFEPGRLSPRRRPQFTTDAKGSHASAKAVEDAFHFIEGQSTDR